MKQPLELAEENESLRRSLNYAVGYVRGVQMAHGSEPQQSEDLRRIFANA